jgi:catechol 2,3-dioxygenase-like lactoylglutathione lyase family enzyme
MDIDMKEYKTFTSFSVDDIEQAKDFYTNKLELESETMDRENVLLFQTGGDTRFLIYRKEDHEPAGYTVLNFEVTDVGSTLARLAGKGVKFEPVEGTNEEGISEMDGVRAAWIKDPAGNWLGLFQRQP